MADEDGRSRQTKTKRTDEAEERVIAREAPRDVSTVRGLAGLAGGCGAGVGVFAMTATGLLQGYSGLRDQLERAVVSVSNNIAEGFERGTRDELLTFLYYAKGSAGEVRSMLHLLERLPDFPVPVAELDELRARSEDISRQLGAWIESAKNRDDKGPRHRTQQSREAGQSAQRQEIYMKNLRRLVDERRTDRRDGPNDPA